MSTPVEQKWPMRAAWLGQEPIEGYAICEFWLYHPEITNWDNTEIEFVYLISENGETYTHENHMVVVSRTPATHPAQADRNRANDDGTLYCILQTDNSTHLPGDWIAALFKWKHLGETTIHGVSASYLQTVRAQRGQPEQS